MRANRTWRAYQAAVAICFCAAAYTCWVWIGEPFMLQEGARNDAILICAEHPSCAAIKGALVLNRQTHVVERKLVLVVRERSNPADVLALRRQITSKLEKHIDRSPRLAAMLPMEVNHER